MTTKTSANTVNVIAVLYAPIDEPISSVEDWSQRYATILAEHCGADDSGYEVIAPETAN